MNRKEDYDSYEIEEPSDEERALSSSEDELDVLLHGTPDQKRKLLREYLTGESESSSGDEFEKEMEAELSSTMKSMEGKWSTPASSEGTSGTTGGTAAASGSMQPRQYDDVYFDTDSEDDETPGQSEGRRRKQRRIPTNDELLYDPDEDDRDQAWVDAKRKQYRSKKKLPASANRKGKSEALPSSDAVLNCPACMTTLCLDCQRHEKYRTQYRAMFVMNCRVNKDEVLRYKTPADRRRIKRRKKIDRSQQVQPVAMGAEVTEAEPEETYHPVQCTECSTEVAVFDKDEVYHFFNILASHC